MPRYLEARQQVIDSGKPLPAVQLPLAEALGLVLAQPVTATETIPPFPNSAMDGFALRAVDAAAPVRLRVLEDLPAGKVARQQIVPGTAIRIMTGAPLPEGADAVVPVEDTASGPDWVEIRRPATRGAHIRQAGEDVRAGSVVLDAGAVLRPAEIGLLAAIGCPTVPVHRRPRVAVITTGDELIDIAAPLGPGLIRDANIHSMSAQITAAGAVPLPFPQIPDRHEAVRAALKQALTEADLILTNGGISVGDFDFIKAVLLELGAEQTFWKVDQKPGRPLALFRLRETPVVGIPGNPVTALVMIEEYVRPLLRRMLGCVKLFRPVRTAALVDGFSKRTPDGKVHLLRVRAEPDREGGWVARLAGAQGSGILSTMVRANALAVIPEEVVEIAAGGPVSLHMIEEPEAL